MGSLRDKPQRLEDLSNLFRIYNSNLDLPKEIKLKFLQEAKNRALKEIC